MVLCTGFDYAQLSAPMRTSSVFSCSECYTKQSLFYALLQWEEESRRPLIALFEFGAKNQSQTSFSPHYCEVGLNSLSCWLAWNCLPSLPAELLIPAWSALLPLPLPASVVSRSAGRPESEVAAPAKLILTWISVFGAVISCKSFLAEIFKSLL